MVRLLRFALLAVIALLLVSVVMAIVTDTTGALAKLFLAAVGLLLVFAASWARRLGAPPRQLAPWAGYRALSGRLGGSESRPWS